MIEKLHGLGCMVVDHVWEVIATDGTTKQVMDGNAYGMK